MTSVLGNYSEVIEQLEARKLRALAATSSTRIEPLPDLPTVAESGYKGYDVQVWFGLIAPAKTAKKTLSELGAWFTASMHAPEVKPKLLTLGLYPVGKCGADFGAFIHTQYDDYTRIVREADIKVE